MKKKEVKTAYYAIVYNDYIYLQWMMPGFSLGYSQNKQQKSYKNVCL